MPCMNTHENVAHMKTKRRLSTQACYTKGSDHGHDVRSFSQKAATIMQLPELDKHWPAVFTINKNKSETKSTSLHGTKSQTHEKRIIISHIQSYYMYIINVILNMYM